MTENLEASAHASAARRIAKGTSDTQEIAQLLSCIRSSLSSSTLDQPFGCKRPLTGADYLEVIDWTARLTSTDTRGVIDATEPSIFRKPGLAEWQWSAQVPAAGTRYWRVIGSAQSLIAKAAAIGQSWLRGSAVRSC